MKVFTVVAVALCLTLTPSEGQMPPYMVPQMNSGFNHAFDPWQSPIPDYFGGYGGSPNLPRWGGAGIGERHANGLDRFGRGFFPLPIN